MINRAGTYLAAVSIASFLLTACAAGADKTGGTVVGAPASAAGQETTSSAAAERTESGNAAAGQESSEGVPLTTMGQTGDEGGLSRGSEFILPDVSTRLYTQEELETLPADQLKLARNEIYARHGRKFKDPSLQAYFQGKSWYHGTVEPEQFNENLLNQTEQDNLELLTRLEDEALNGRTGYPAPPYAKAIARWDSQHKDQKISGDLYQDGVGSVNSTDQSMLIKHDKYYEITDCQVMAQGVYDKSLFAGRKAGDLVTLDGTNYKIQSITAGEDGLRGIELRKASSAESEDGEEYFSLQECSVGFCSKGDNDTMGPWIPIYEGSIYFYRDARIVTGRKKGEKTITAKEYFETLKPDEEQRTDIDDYTRAGGLMEDGSISLLGYPTYDQSYYFTGFRESFRNWVG